MRRAPMRAAAIARASFALDGPGVVLPRGKGLWQPTAIQTG